MINIKEDIYKEVLKRKSLRIRKEESSFFFRASEAGDCKLVLFNKKLNVAPNNSFKDTDNEAEVEMLLEDGAMHQEMVTKHIERVGRFKVTNVEDSRVFHVTNGDYNFTVTGHPDLILHDDETGKTYVVDVKSISTYYCKTLKDNDIDALKQIYPTGYKSIPQVRLYMSDHMFNTDGAIVLLKDKNNSRLFEFFIEKDETRSDRIIKRFKEVQNACMKQSPPQCDFVEGDKRCKYCPYSGQCGM